uniref:Uncharacterized protein n=1 Tax=Podarcis muralis TaxID=64176 RepID=A0A670IWE1_PODMU
MKRLKGILRLKKRRAAEQQPASSASSEAAGEVVVSACASCLASDGAYVVRKKELGQLHRAAAEGSLGDVQRLVQRHDINEPDKDSRTPLHLACAGGYTDIVAFLVGNKCQLNFRDNEGKTPLMKAVQCQQEFCAIYLLENGADPNIVDAHSNTALHFAAANSGVAITKHLLKYNADIEAQNEDGNTPLIVAVTENNREIVEFLLEEGASVNATDNSGRYNSVSLLKIQNICHEYESLIERERGCSIHLRGKVKKIENEKKEQQRILEEMTEMKSTLDHKKVEWESTISSLKFSLKQEEEKRTSAERLYEENQEQLRKKEEQYYKQTEEKQQLELMLRSLEMEFRTLKNHLKQIEEERNEAQQQLSQEKSARALQEGILNTHLWRQKELEEELKKTAAIQSEMTDNHAQEKELLNKNRVLEDELTVLRLELEHIRVKHQEEETRYLEENELKVNEETLTQTIFQYNGQINLSKTEVAILTSKLEHFKENKERLEGELDSVRSRSTSAAQELERCQILKNDLERTLQRECDEWLRVKEKLNHDLCHLRETNNGMSEQLRKAESKANSLEHELHQVTHSLREKSMQLESVQRDLNQAHSLVKELENTRQVDKEQMNKYVVKQESMQERLAQLQSENLLLRQQFEDFQNKGIIKEKVVSDVQDRFNDIFNKLRADTEKQVQMKEEVNKELIAKCNNLKEEVLKYEAEKADREVSGTIRQLKQELADSLKKQSMSEASLEVSTRYRIDLEEDKQHLQKEIDRMKFKCKDVGLTLLKLEHEKKKVKKLVELKRSVEARRVQVESTNCELRDQLSSMKLLERSKQQLEEEITNLKRHIQDNMMDLSQIEQYKREIEERARQDISQKLEQVNLFLQTQAASQETMEQMRATNYASLRNQLENRIKDLECELAVLRNRPQDNNLQRESVQSELERYKALYSEERKMRKSLGSKLDRANEKLTEASTKLLHERHKSKSLLANSFMSGSYSSSPVLETVQVGSLGSNLALSRSPTFGGAFMNPTGSTASSKMRVEAYLAKMRTELEKTIAKELEQATVELDAGPVRVSPIGSIDESSKQDEVSKARKEYLDVLKKNYMI